MKYWDELNNLDTAIVELLGTRDLLELVAVGIQDASAVEMRAASAVFTLSAMLDKQIVELQARFDVLFKTVRDDGNKKLGAPKAVKRVKTQTPKTKKTPA